MTTSQTFTTGRPATLELHLPNGTADVKVDPAADHVTVIIATNDDSGPSADAVNGTTGETTGTTYAVRVPLAEVTLAPWNTAGSVGPSAVVGIQSNIVTGSTVVVNQRIGTVEPGSHVVGMQIGGASTPSAPSVVNGSEIHVDVTLPPGTSVEVEGDDVCLTTSGRLETLGFKTIAGVMRAGSVANARVKATAATVRIDEVQGTLDVKTVSGSVAIGAYRGVTGTVKTTTAPITIAVTGQASGRLNLSSISGDVTVTGAGVLDNVEAKTMTGRTSINNR